MMHRAAGILSISAGARGAVPLSQGGQLLRRRGHSWSAQASGLATHRDSIVRRLAGADRPRGAGHPQPAGTRLISFILNDAPCRLSTVAMSDIVVTVRCCRSRRRPCARRRRRTSAPPWVRSFMISDWDSHTFLLVSSLDLVASEARPPVWAEIIHPTGEDWLSAAHNDAPCPPFARHGASIARPRLTIALKIGYQPPITGAGGDHGIDRHIRTGS
jgi:hypothetical protein